MKVHVPLARSFDSFLDSENGRNKTYIRSFEDIGTPVPLRRQDDFMMEPTEQRSMLAELRDVNGKSKGLWRVYGEKPSHSPMQTSITEFLFAEMEPVSKLRNGRLFENTERRLSSDWQLGSPPHSSASPGYLDNNCCNRSLDDHHTIYQASATPSVFQQNVRGASERITT